VIEIFLHEYLVTSLTISSMLCSAPFFHVYLVSHHLHLRLHFDSLMKTSGLPISIPSPSIE